MKSEESARGEGRSIILFIRVLTYDYDTQIFSGLRDVSDTHDCAEKRNVEILSFM